MKKALITGITGQDGSFLAELLLEKGYEVHGIIRRSSNFNTQRIDHLIENEEIYNQKLFLHFGDLTDGSRLVTLMAKLAPDEIYNLSGESSVAKSFLTPEQTASSNVLGVLNLLNAVKEIGLQEQVRIFQASSSDMFGPSELQLNEDSPLSPKSPYGVSKFLAHKMCRQYREEFGVWVSSGILFNHESELRPQSFVFQKIIKSLVEISLGKRQFLELGNLEIYRDWGYAGDYVEAMQKSLQAESPHDYVIATGRLNSLRNVIEKTCEILGLDGDVDSFVKINKSLMRPLDIERTWGDPKFAEDSLDWKAMTTFEEIVGKMVRVNLSNLD